MGATPFVTAIGSIGNVRHVLISALESKGLVRELASPRSISPYQAIQQAFWPARVPIPVVQPSSGSTPTITVDYKQFGVQLTFLPTGAANGIMYFRLTPSVSELDYANAIQNQASDPALKKRSPHNH